MNNLTTCLIFLKYDIYNFSDCLGKIFRVLFFYSKLYQCFLITVHFCLICKLVSILSITKSLFAFTFFTIFDMVEVAKPKNCAMVSTPTPFWGKTTPYPYFQHMYQRSCSFCYNILNFIFLKI